MIAMFKTANKAAVMAAFATLHGKLKPAETLLDKAQSGVTEIRLAMKGGPDALRQLQSKQGESSIARRNRAAAFENPNILRLVVDTQADLAYGNPPERNVALKSEPDSQTSKDLSRRFVEVYESERVTSAFRLRTAPWSLRDNSSVVKVWYDPSEDSIRISTFKKEFVPFIHDPADADRFLGAVELVKQGGGKWARYLWTTQETGWIDESWNWTPGPNGEPAYQENPTPGITQYIQFGFDHPSDDCGSAMWDIYLSQIQQTQLRSQVATGARAQLLSIPWISGQTNMRKQRDPATGQEYVYLGHDKPLLLEKEGSAGFMTPGFKLSEASDYEMARFKHYLEVYGVSATAVDSSNAPDQPMALAIKLYRSMRERSKHLAAFKDSEMVLANSVLALAAYHDLWPEVGLQNVDDVDISIKFPENILPTDKMLERQQQAGEVEKNLLLRKRWLKRWVDPDASDDEIKQEEAALDEQAAKAAQRVTDATAAAVAPRGGTGAVGPVAGGNGQSARDALLNGINAGRDALNGAAS